MLRRIPAILGPPAPLRLRSCRPPPCAPGAALPVHRAGERRGRSYLPKTAITNQARIVVIEREPGFESIYATYCQRGAIRS